MFRTVPLSIIRSFSLYIQQWYIICHTGLLTACAVSKPVWHKPWLYVQWKTPDDGHRNCPKHVEFYSKNKFQKLVLLVGFIIRIYHDAELSERQMRSLYSIGDVWREYVAVVQSYWKGNLKYSERNLSQCYFVHRILHMKWAGIELGPLRWVTGD